MPKRIILTDRYQRFCWEYVFGEHYGNARQCYMKAYPDSAPSTLRFGPWRLMKMPIILNEIKRLKEESGLTEETVKRKIREGLEANIITTFQGVTRQTEFPDYTTRHKYIEMSAKILSMFPAQQVESRSINIDLQLEKLSPPEVAKLLNEANKKNVRPETETNILKEGKTESPD